MLDRFFGTLKCFLRIILFHMNAISYLDQTLSNKSKNLYERRNINEIRMRFEFGLT